MDSGISTLPEGNLLQPEQGGPKKKYMLKKPAIQTPQNQDEESEDTEGEMEPRGMQVPEKTELTRKVLKYLQMPQ